MRIWDVAPERERTPPIPFEGAKVRLAFWPDDQSLTTIPIEVERGAAKVWSVATGHLRAEMKADVGSTVAVAHHSRSWAATVGDTIISLWVPDTGRLIRAFWGITGQLRSLASSPDDQRLVAGLLDGSVTIWERADHSKAPVVFKHSNQPTGEEGDPIQDFDIVRV